MILSFWKMQGLGNDFIVLDSRSSRFVPKPALVRRMCDRHFGIGADQVLVLLASRRADFRMRIFNADASEAEMCGNGIRCIARFIQERRISTKKKLEIETLAGVIRPEITRRGVKVNMGRPEFEPEKVPADFPEPVLSRPYDVDGHLFEITVLSMGNPHCVIPVEFVDGVPLGQLGPLIERHRLFPQGVNVEFVQIIDRGHLKARVWERGSGETLACGTGACAAAVACARTGLADRKVTVILPGGDLKIEWRKDTDLVFMTGPAEFVFQGKIKI